MDLLVEFGKWLISQGITPLEILTLTALAFGWRDYRNERREWKTFMESITIRYETLLNENIQSLAIIEAKLDKQD